MLVVGPNSTCDVCLECYTNGVNIPHAISCGHVFCQKCLEHLVQHKCPLCRVRFSPQEVRKLHVDRDPNVKSIIDEEPSQPAASAPEADEEAQRLLNEIARIVKEGAKINEIRRVIDGCRTYYKSQGDHYTPVRISCLLLHNLAEAQRKLSLQADELKGLRVECEDIRERLTEELEAAELRYEDLQRSRQEEIDALLAKEKSLRDHYDEMNQSWLCEVLSLERERDSLKQTLERFHASRSEYPQPPVELRCFYSVDPKRASTSTDELTMIKKANMKQKLLDEDDVDFHLSPLVEVAVPLASTLPTFRALADESDEEDLKKKKKKVPSPEPTLDVVSPIDGFYAETPMAHPTRQPYATEPIPIPIPSRAAPSHHASSSVAMSVTADYWPTTFSGSKPREDVVMSSRPPSPCRRASSSDRHILSQEAAPKTREFYVADTTERHPRDSEPASEDTWQILSSGVTKLRDLLDSPQVSTLPPHVMSRPDVPRSSTASLSRSSTLNRPISHSSVPTRPSSASVQSASGSSAVEDPYFAQTERRPLVSASEAAMQLERERQEKERRRRHEASSATPPVPSSLRDATNAPANAHYHPRYKYSSDKMKTMHSVPGTACV